MVEPNQALVATSAAALLEAGKQATKLIANSNLVSKYGQFSVSTLSGLLFGFSISKFISYMSSDSTPIKENEANQDQNNIEYPDYPTINLLEEEQQEINNNNDQVNIQNDKDPLKIDTENARQTITIEEIKGLQGVKIRQHANGELTYDKRKLTKMQLNNYMTLDNLGIGIAVTKINQIDEDEYEISTPHGGEVLTQYLMNSMDIEKLTQLKDELDKIKGILRAKQIAHTDIKPSNMVILDGQLKLIDNGDCQNYGEQRKVSTLKINFNFHGEIVSLYTDDRGFSFVKTLIDKRIQIIREKLDKKQVKQKINE